MRNNRRIFILNRICILLLVFLTACGSKEKSEKLDETINQVTAEREGHACINVFYPLKLGNQWIYRPNLEDQSFLKASSDIVISVPETRDASAVVSVINNDASINARIAFECIDGAIINFPVTELNMGANQEGNNLKLEYVSGVYMPSEEDFSSKNWQMAWNSEYKANGQIGATYEGESFSVLLSSAPIKVDWQIMNSGTALEVPAGKFENVVHIQRNIEMDITKLEASIEGKRINLPAKLKLTTQMFYAPGVGLLKMELDSVTVTFFGINYPLEVPVSVELASYHLDE
ncbi:MAG: hypothetical protein KA449_02370 [Pelolinea sp.]|nr:hypothetical protein [Pelolinea sp.]